MRRGIAVGLAAGVAVAVVVVATRTADPPNDRLERAATRTLAQISGTIRVPGLRARVTVRRDRWGVPHIVADNADDLFFAQGYVMAQDRLWQMELWRRGNEGRLAEWLGPSAVPRDRRARLLAYRGPFTDEEWRVYHPDAHRIFTAYAAGVNAFIAEGKLPIELELTGLRPEPWAAETLVSRTPAFGDAATELALARDVARLGVDEASKRNPVVPANALEVPGGFDPALVDDAVIAAVARLGEPARPALVEPYRSWPELMPANAAADARPPGSNAWVVGGLLSATGKPIVANDPHRAIAMPSLRYVVHLQAPGWNVAGASEPPFVGVAIGHNDRVAWGLTFTSVDQEDVYVEELDPTSPSRVRVNDDWVPLQVVREEIRVRGAASVTVDLEFSRHGPIFHKDRRRAYALRSVRREPGTAPYLAGLRLAQTRDCRELVDAAMYWRAPQENLVCGDVDGGIAWVVAAAAPRRHWSGRLPVPGMGAYEWAGFRTDLPRALDPARGFVIMANNNVQLPHVPPAGFRPAADTEFERLIRLEQLIVPDRRYTLDDHRAIQLDVLSLRAAADLARFRDWTAADPSVERARRILAGWDARLSRDNPAAALWATWRAIDPTLADEATLARAVERLTREQGADPDAWRWGRMHAQAFRHPLAAAFDAGTVERAGGLGTVADDGASYRQILDTASWDRSIVTNTPGQSGQPQSPFYGNLLPLWAEDRYFPLVFSAARVEAETTHTLVLEP